jgi:hypothetical protein
MIFQPFLAGKKQKNKGSQKSEKIDFRLWVLATTPQPIYLEITCIPVRTSRLADLLFFQFYRIHHR